MATRKPTTLDGLAKVLYNQIKGKALDEALAGKKPADRIGMFQDLLIKALLKSTIHCFNGRPYYFDGRIYVPLGGGSWDSFYSLIKRVADRCGLSAGDKTRLEGVNKVCRRELIDKILEPDNHIIVLNNGVLDVEDGKFHNFSPKFKQVTQMDFDYKPDEYPNVWEGVFLDRVLPDKRWQRVLQEFMGAIFIDRAKAKIEEMLILKGSGSNGKSVVFETIKGLLGEDNIMTISLSELISGGDRKQNVASINGKRLNYCSEIQTQEFGNNADALKKLISGEPVVVRLVYANNFTARNIPLLMANANRMPYIKDWSHGMGRRLIIMPFDVIISEKEQNKTLARELQKEYPAILNWILAGRQSFISNGYKFHMDDDMRDIVNEYQAESSTVLQYMRFKGYNRTLLDIEREPRWLEAEKLYFAYVKWCNEQCLTVESQKKFSTVLVEAGFTKSRNREGVTYAVYPTYERTIPTEYKPMDDKGVVDGMENLAHWLKVSRQTVEKLMRIGALEGCYYKEGRKHKFDLADCRDAYRKFMRSVKRRKSVQPVSDELKAERRAFNNRMRDHKQPFRKAESPQPHSRYIYVNDDFDYQLDKDNWERFVKFKKDDDNGK